MENELRNVQPLIERKEKETKELMDKLKVQHFLFFQVVGPHCDFCSIGEFWNFLNRVFFFYFSKKRDKEDVAEAQRIVEEEEMTLTKEKDIIEKYAQDAEKDLNTALPTLAQVR